MVKLPPDVAEALRARLLADPPTELVTRWQQLSGAVMAKGHEDTACYRFPALLAQNEVGGDPGADARDAVTRFHALATVHRGLVGTSTHDTKRSEDVRARLCVLTERAEAFEQVWRAGASSSDPGPTVTPVEQRFVAQTLLGAWPLDPDDMPDFERRIEQYLRKALREAKQQTNWIHPNEHHEEAVIECARRTIADDGRLLRRGVRRSRRRGRVLRRDQLARDAHVEAGHARDTRHLPGVRAVGPVAGGPRQPSARRLRTARTAAARRAAARRLAFGRGQAPCLCRRPPTPSHAPRAVRDGELVPLEAPETVFAFARRLGDEWAIAIAPRFPTRVTECGRWPIGDVWGDTTIALPGRRTTCVARGASSRRGPRGSPGRAPGLLTTARHVVHAVPHDR